MEQKLYASLDDYDAIVILQGDLKKILETKLSFVMYTYSKQHFDSFHEKKKTGHKKGWLQLLSSSARRSIETRFQHWDWTEETRIHLTVSQKIITIVHQSPFYRMGKMIQIVIWGLIARNEASPV